MANKTRELTAADCCLILKGAKEAGVRKLSFRGLEVDFGVAAPMWPVAQAFDETPTAVATAAPIEDKKFLEQEVAAKQDRAAESVIDDPELFEELVATNELIRKAATDGTTHEEAGTR